MTEKEVSEHKTPRQSRAQAGEVSAPQAENLLSQRIAAGPVMAAQRKAIEQMNSPKDAIQRLAPEEEELMQGKFAAQLLPEEEEELPAQGTFNSGLSRKAAGDVE